ncbi:transcriptional regulator [Thermosphaera aggregans]|uniref:Transcriptional regulator protein n=1 Tax=Thermosphaera aggregans (strain DSM 11486 / M11TL) TaxID=633148 RepID=D5U2M2_THEAM|nr:transcriptional regulator [Thermosphaera aggregans]ADG91372.1 transcriptional regulator protein [Thermosphaera aggregans DSM 11486]
MNEQAQEGGKTIELVIDFSNIPLKPVGKKEIQQLETALIIGTLFRPEIAELLRDPVERATWVDSLAIAASALARSKAGMMVPQIAEELGRTETTIRAHLSGKTKAGKLVAETYDKLKAGELKLSFPFITGLKIGEERVKELEAQLEEARSKNAMLEYQLEEARKRIAELESLINEKEKLISELSEQNKTLLSENQDLKYKLESLTRLIGDLKKLLESAGF